MKFTHTDTDTYTNSNTYTQTLCKKTHDLYHQLLAAKPYPECSFPSCRVPSPTSNRGELIDNSCSFTFLSVPLPYPIVPLSILARQTSKDSRIWTSNGTLCPVSLSSRCTTPRRPWPPLARQSEADPPAARNRPPALPAGSGVAKRHPCPARPTPKPLPWTHTHTHIPNSIPARVSTPPPPPPPGIVRSLRALPPSSSLLACHPLDRFLLFPLYMPRVYPVCSHPSLHRTHTHPPPSRAMRSKKARPHTFPPPLPSADYHQPAPLHTSPFTPTLHSLAQRLFSLSLSRYP